MLRFGADQNVDGDILRGLRRRLPGIDVARVVDVGLSQAADPEVLEWAASEERVLSTHDSSTMTAFAYERLERGLPLSGVVVMGSGLSTGRAIEDLVTMAECSTADEWSGQVVYLPL